MKNYYMNYNYYIDRGNEEYTTCEWAALLTPKANNKVIHDLLIDDCSCKCALEGEFTYELKEAVLYISNSTIKMQLVRKK